MIQPKMVKIKKDKNNKNNRVKNLKAIDVIFCFVLLQKKIFFKY